MFSDIIYLGDRMEKELKNKFMLLTYGIILFVFLINYEWLINIGKFLLDLFSPFIIGAIIALILNVLVNSFEDKILKKMNKGKRFLSILLSLAIVIGFIIFVISIIVPQFKNAGEIFINNLPNYQENINDIGNKIGLSEEVLNKIDFTDVLSKSKVTDLLKNNYQSILNISFGFASSIVSTVVDMFIAIVFAIYILASKEDLLKGFKKLLKKLSKEKVYYKVAHVMDLSDRTFSNFIKVQFVEACILGVLCFLCMLLLRFPYAATISVIVGFTALIPVFGAFIGCVIGAFLIFMVNPIQALTFIAFFLILQQLEGNFIYPKVVGGKIGLPSIWVLVAVTIGGSLGGVVGMLFGVPILSVIYTLIKEYVNSSDKKVITKTEEKKS